jgi:hypothetical protein
MKSSQKYNLREKWMETGRVIAHAMNEVEVQKEKNMAKAEKRKATMLENAAERALSGN